MAQKVSSGYLCAQSLKEGGNRLSPLAKQREAWGGEKHIPSKGKAQRESLGKSRDMEQISPSGLLMERWDQEWVGWEQTVKGHECPDKEFGLYPLDFWGPSEIFFTQGSPQPLSCSVHCCQPPLVVFWASQEQGQHDLITFLFRNITGHFTHCTVGTVPPATGFDDTWLKLLLVYAVDTDDQF